MTVDPSGGPDHNTGRVCTQYKHMEHCRSVFIQITCHISLKVSDRPQTSEETLTTVSPVTQHVAETLHTVFYSSP